jgi:hypothetical protein
MITLDIHHDAAVSPNLAAADATTVCAYPQVTATEDGALHCCYRHGSAKHGPDGALLLQSSTDDGLTWSAPCAVWDETMLDPPRSVVTGGICGVGADLVVTFCTVTMLERDTYIFSDEGRAFPRQLQLVRSSDRGATWSPPQALPWDGDLSRAGIASSPELLATGDLLIPLEVRLASGPQGTAAALSGDGGRSAMTTRPVHRCTGRVRPMAAAAGPRRCRLRSSARSRSHCSWPMVCSSQW